jgi:predicted RNase H-like HicB family nuclease
MKSRKTVHLVIERKGDGTLIGSIPELPGVHTQAKDIAALRKETRRAVQRFLDEHPESVATGYAARFVGVEELTF